MYPERQSRIPGGGFWYRDVVHFGEEPLYPLDAYFTVSMMDLAQSYYYGRFFSMPTSSGRDTALVEGRPFRTSYPPRPLDISEFERRARRYLEHWDEIYEEWKRDVLAVVEEMRSLDLSLPEGVDGGGRPPAPFRVVEGWFRLYLLWLRLWFRHYELLMLGYMVYQLFYKFVKTFFPDAPDHHIAAMLAAEELDTLRPERELEDLAKLARELGIADRIASFATAGEMEEAFSKSGDPRERLWLERWNAVKYPWFYVSTGTGFLHWERRWVDDLDIPFSYLKSLLKESGGAPRRVDGLKLAEGYSQYLPEELRGAFRMYLEAARRAYRFIEEHSFYVEHLGFTVGYMKIREFGSLLARLGVLDSGDDIWLLTWGEVFEALLDGLTGWCNLQGPAASGRFRQRVAERRRLMEDMRRTRPPDYIGEAPEKVSDPNLAMLHGVARRSDGVLRGVPASPGRARGPVVVVRSPADLEKVRDGAVLVGLDVIPHVAPGAEAVRGYCHRKRRLPLPRGYIGKRGREAGGGGDPRRHRGFERRG
ncbi:PEP-utilizing enzyme, mobile region [Pyrobaculum ferrireducens]|uniref:PEP-utilizing enzyme, mobile region n=1 Tax=Pyrobaculum ferrireducens TaxID=1104324 RepID=G7VHK6_9CREN|nr:PEP-utilizing enzyme, mobile region [Pyrobaculum ferrireducens]